MIFSTSTGGLEWSLDFGPDSVTLTVKDLVQELTISCQQILLAAWKLLLSQRQDFLNNQLASVPITSNKLGTMEMRETSSVCTQDMDKRGIQVYNLEDIEFHC